MNRRIAALFSMTILAGCQSGAGLAADDPSTSSVKSHPDAELRNMQEYLRTRIDRTAIAKTLHTARGRNVDCVDIYQQPALHGRPLAAPPKVIDNTRAGRAPSSSLRRVESLFDASGKDDVCEPGTVPIPEVTMADLLRFRTLDDYFRKVPSHLGVSQPPPSLRRDDVHIGPTASHQYAHAYRSVTNWGAQMIENLWDPSTETNSEFSLGQMWVSARGATAVSLQTVEAGFQHYHDLYNDDGMHLFCYSTRDGYLNLVHPGCYNNSCGDFVQVSTTVFLGAEYAPVSESNGFQKEIDVHWSKGGPDGDWWLAIDGENVGYYPKALFDALGQNADHIDFGGEIVDTRASGHHTSTQMGSGEFASAGYLHAASMRRLRYHDSNPMLDVITTANVTGLTAAYDDAKCYSVSYNESSSADWLTYLFYGGPGYDPVNCN
jgi:hypothetical protein